eukprot:gb/GEZN01005421.1/.p1 GENE.gb/GEZN01005421.1/~~gb/GEZN01005421.1/.p1  ORF type:complete len:553 (-),score=166.54 gb/GEZN01005421.1/:66-1724(-)
MTTRSATKKRKRPVEHKFSTPQPPSRRRSEVLDGAEPLDEVVSSNGSRAGGSPKSPLQASDPIQEDATTLQELNKRLELYILWQRERDQDQGGLTEQLSRAQKLHEEQRDVLEKKLKQERTQYRQKLSELTKARDDALNVAKGYETEARQLAKRVGNAENKADTAKARQEECVSELREVKAKCFAQEQELSRVKHQQETDAQRLAQLEQELVDEKQRCEAADSQLQEASSARQSLTEDLEAERTERKQLVDRYKSQSSELSGTKQQIEADLRREFVKQMQEHLKERQEQQEREKEEALTSLSGHYREQIEGLQSNCSDLEQKLAQAQALLNPLRSSVSDSATQLAQVQEANQQLQTQIQNLQAQVKEAHNAHAAESAQQQAMVNQLKEVVRRKDEEFNELMDVKIALAMEIKQYHTLLEDEEERLGLAAQDNGEGVGLHVQQEEVSPLLITGMDVKGKYVKIRNHSTESMELQGWSMRSDKTGKQFVFPNKTLKPGGTVVVWTGSNNRKKESGANTLVWAEDDVWDTTEGDTATLYSPGGLLCSQVDVVPSV